MRPNDRSRPPARRAAPTNTVEAQHTIRGPYRTQLGTLTRCSRHPWAAPSLSIIGGAASVCFEDGHVVELTEVAA
jgi:hypothetical protein